jgi:hypothetical protein
LDSRPCLHKDFSENKNQQEHDERRCDLADQLEKVGKTPTGGRGYIPVSVQEAIDSHGEIYT